MKIEHDEKARLVYFDHEAHRGELRYTNVGENLDLTHTHVPEPLEDRGYGTQLVEAAIAFATTNAQKIVPSCPFVAAYFDKHPEAQAVLAEA